MSLGTDLSEVKGGIGNTTQFIFKEQPGFKNYGGIKATPIIIASNGNASGGDFPKFQGVPSGVDLALAGALIDPAVFTGTRTRSKGYPGVLRGQGGVVLGGSPLIAPSIFRLLLQDKNPSYHILGGTGVTIPAEKTVVDGQALPGTTPKTVAEDLASTTNPVRLTVTLKAGTASTVDVVDAQDLSGDGSKTIASDLSDYDVPFTLTVTPNNSAALSDTAVDATLVIEGTDAQGRFQVDTLTFPNASKTDAQTTTKKFLEVTDVSAMGWSAGTVTISASLVDAVTLGDDIEFARVRIKGTDHQGRAFAENFTFTDDNKATAQTSKRYFATVTEVTGSGWVGGAIDIKGRDKACRVTIKPQDEEIVIFWNGEINRGIIPEVLDDMLMQQITIQISREEVMRYACVFVFRDSAHQVNFAGDSGETARKTDASGLDFPVDDFFIGYQAEITIDGIRLAITEATLTINQQYAPSNVISGEPTDEAVPTGGTRLVGLTGNVKYATQNDFNENFRENIEFNNIQIRFFNKLKGGFPSQLRLRGASGELNQNPVPTYTDAGEILQPFELNLLPSRIGALDDIVAIVDVPEYQRGRIYA